MGLCSASYYLYSPARTGRPGSGPDPTAGMAWEDLAKLAIYSPAGLIALEDSALLLHSLLSHVNNSTLDICLY